MSIGHCWAGHHICPRTGSSRNPKPSRSLAFFSKNLIHFIHMRMLMVDLQMLIIDEGLGRSGCHRNFFSYNVCSTISWLLLLWNNAMNIYIRDPKWVNFYPCSCVIIFLNLINYYNAKSTALMPNLLLSSCLTRPNQTPLTSDGLLKYIWRLSSVTLHRRVTEYFNVIDYEADPHFDGASQSEVQRNESARRILTPYLTTMFVFWFSYLPILWLVWLQWWFGEPSKQRRTISVFSQSVPK